MLHFRSLDVYRCAVSFVPKAYAIAEDLDRELAAQLRRAVIMIPICIADESLAAARASALQCAAVLDMARVVGLTNVDDADALLMRVLECFDLFDGALTSRLAGDD